MPPILASSLLYSLAACAEISGCFSAWAWLRLGKSPLWLIPGSVCLGAFAILLTYSPTEHAGRAYALYGGIYIIASLIWGWLAEGTTPDGWDLLGAAFCLGGAGLILLAPHGQGCGH